MLERLPGLYEITLEEREGASINIQLYLIKGKPGERDLLVDSGYGTPWSRAHLLAALDELQVDIALLDVFLTHKHADHCGLAHELETRGARLFMNREEDRHQYDCLYYRLDHSNENAQKRVLTRTGITPETAPLIWQKYMDFNDRLSEEHPVWMMTIDEFSYDTILPGQRFDCGAYHFEAIPLRGHTYGQMGLWDREKKLLLCADQILNRTTPIVGTSHADEHLLKSYLDGICGMVQTYADHLLLPAHEGPIEDLAACVARTTAAYQRKIDQTFAAVREDEELTVWQIAKQVYGLTPDKRSDAAFYNSKMITTKTFSMLEYLHDTGKIRRREENGMLFWRR